MFLGSVRNGPEEQGVTAIEYSAYEEMVEAEFGRLLADARGRWPDARIAVRHRLGRIPVGEAVSAAPEWRCGRLFHLTMGLPPRNPADEDRQYETSHRRCQ